MSNIKQVHTNCCYKSYCFSKSYYSDDENDTELDPINNYDEYSHREIIDRCDFGQNHMIHTRLSSNKSLIQERVQTSIKNNLLSSDQNNGNDGPSKQQTNKTFPTMLKLIHGALIGGVNYEKNTWTQNLQLKRTLQSHQITQLNTKIQIHTKYQPSMTQLEKLPDSRNKN